MFEILLLSCLSLCGTDGAVPRGVSLTPLCVALQQEPQGEGVRKAEQKKVEDKAPPIEKLNPVNREKAKRFLRALKTTNPKRRRTHEDKIIALGRGAIPVLLEKRGTTNANQAVGLERCLFELLDVRDADILKELTGSKKLWHRRVAAMKYSSSGRDKDRDALKAFIKDSDMSIRFEAALGLVRLADPTGIGEIVLKIGQGDDKDRKRALEDLNLLKGHVYSSHFRSLATRHEDPKVRKATIEVIVAIGDRKVKDVLGLTLSDDHNLVKSAAVNGLRKLLKDEEPITFPTVFDLVDAVEKWKKELGLIRK